MCDTGSTGASTQSAGKRRFTVSDGAIRATAATTVDDGGGGESPSRALNPAAKPPTPAPPKTARQATTLLLILLDSPRMSPNPLTPPKWGCIFFAKRA